MFPSIPSYDEFLISVRVRRGKIVKVEWIEKENLILGVWERRQNKKSTRKFLAYSPSSPQVKCERFCPFVEEDCHNVSIKKCNSIWDNSVYSKFARENKLHVLYLADPKKIDEVRAVTGNYGKFDDGEF